MFDDAAKKALARLDAMYAARFYPPISEAEIAAMNRAPVWFRYPDDHKPLGAEFEAVWDANVDKLHES